MGKKEKTNDRIANYLAEIKPGFNKDGIFGEKVPEEIKSGKGHFVYYKRGLEQKGFQNILKFTGFTDKNISSMINKLNTYTSSMATLEKITKNLDTLAKQERRKEINVLNKLAPTYNIKNISSLNLINKLNELMGMGEQYKNYLGYLNKIYPKNHAKNMSPVVTSYFSNYFASILTDENNEIFDKLSQKVMKIVKNNGTAAQIKKACKEVGDWIYQKFMENDGDNSFFNQFMEKVEGTNTKELEEQYHFWKELFEKIKQDASIKNEFMQSIMNSFQLQSTVERMVNEIKKEQVNRKKLSAKLKKKAIKTAVTSQSAAKGGLYYEAVNEALQAFNFKKLNGTVFGSSRIDNSHTTDSVTLYTGKISLELQKEIKQKFTEFIETNVSDKEKAVEKTKKFTEWLENNVKDGILIYNNAKSYKQGRLIKDKGYFQGGRRKIADIGELINGRVGRSNNETFGRKFLNGIIDIAVNMTPGAILEDEKENATLQFENLISQSIADKVANLLFDDWETFGYKDNFNSSKLNVIHVFPLNGVLVPLSYVLEKASESFQNTSEKFFASYSDVIKVEIETPKSIKFKIKEQTTAFIDEQTGGRKKDETDDQYYKRRALALVDAWNIQAKEAMAKTKFGMDFLSNFNNLISELYNALPQI